MESRQLPEFRDLIDRAVAAGLVSRPHHPFLPNGHPFRVAVCSVSLPPGCLPPGGAFPRRIASGCGPTDEEAAFKAQAEAVERYSLQYAQSRPARIAPVLVLGGPPDPADIAELTLGAPGSVTPVTSRGAATGDTIEAAAETAALEYLEHHHLGQSPDLKGFLAVDPGRVPALAPHLAFLGAQYRRLTIAVLASPLGFHVARVVCCDVTGARPTVGSAADISSERAILRSSEEAILAWRNMIEIERMGSVPRGPDGEPDPAFRIYRGLEEVEPGPVEPLDGDAPPLIEPIVSRLQEITGRRVRVFDMTVPEIGASVAKVLVG